MIVFPRSASEAAAAAGIVRAGGTDLQERLHKGITKGDLRDLRDVVGMSGVGPGPAGLRVGARTTVAQLAVDPSIVRDHPAVALAAGGLATPQIRAMGTVGGNLSQHVRCAYYRDPHVTCLRRGGSACLSRAGDHMFASVFDLGPCVAPHPSTLATALLTSGALIELAGADALVPLDQWLGDGTSLTSGGDDLIVAVHLPSTSPGQVGAYVRTIARARAEWPVVEVAVRARVVDGVVVEIEAAMGGVAPVPIPLPGVADALRGRPVDPAALAPAAGLATAGANPLPGSAWKVGMIPGTVLDALERALLPGGAA